MHKKQLVAIVTGGSRGIGRSISLQLAKEGIIVIINYEKNREAAETTVKKIILSGGQAEAFQGSVYNSLDVKGIVEKTLLHYGKIDILVNNAGIIRDSLLFSMKETDWKEVISVNLIGVLLFTKGVLKSMMKARFGRIVNIGSISGIIGTPGQTNYATSKAALIGFTRSMAKEVSPYNITINTIAAGYVETEMVKKMDERQLQKYKANIPLQRFCSPEEIALNVSHLLGKEGSYINGQVIIIDGGLSLV